MTISNKSEYIQYRFKRAQESFEEALIMIQNCKWNTAISRLYYSCYYATIALLLKHDIEVRSHSGVRTKFSDTFIKTGKLMLNTGNYFRICLTIDKRVTMETSTITMTKLYFL
jgi:uncharacterized protein